MRDLRDIVRINEQDVPKPFDVGKPLNAAVRREKEANRREALLARHFQHLGPAGAREHARRKVAEALAIEEGEQEAREALKGGRE